jgi:hypothetical protein
MHPKPLSQFPAQQLTPIPNLQQQQVTVIKLRFLKQICNPSPTNSNEQTANPPNVPPEAIKKIRTLRSTVSPRKSCSFSMVSGCSATTELSSFVASSTTRRFGDFFLSRIAVEKSFFPFLCKRPQTKP